MNWESELARKLEQGRLEDSLRTLSFEQLAAMVKEGSAAPLPKPPSAAAKSGPKAVPPPAIAKMKQSVSAMKDSVKKLASADPVAIAEQWGRELAHEHFEKTAALPALGMLAAGLNKVVPMVRPAVAAIGRARPGMAAGVGAALGAGKNIAQHYSKPQEQRGSLLGSAAMGAAGGALGGLALRAGARKAVTMPGYRAAAKGKLSLGAQPAAASTAGAGI